MGGAVDLGGSAASGMFLNPAILADASGGAGALGGDADYFSVTGATVLAGEGQGLGIGVRSWRSNWSSETAMAVGYGRSLFGFEVGLLISYGDQVYGRQDSKGALLDAGVSHEIGPLRVGGALRGVRIGKSRIPIPESVVEFQISTDQFEAGPLDILFAGRVSRIVEGRAARWTSANTEAGLGARVSYWPVTGRTFRFLVGASSSVSDGSIGPTLGGSFSGDEITFEYAYSESGGVGFHRFGLRWD